MHFCAGSLPPWAADLKSGPWKARPDPAVVQGAQVQVQGGAVACLHLQPPARAAPPDPTRPSQPAAASQVLCSCRPCFAPAFSPTAWSLLICGWGICCPARHAFLGETAGHQNIFLNTRDSWNNSLKKEKKYTFAKIATLLIFTTKVLSQIFRHTSDSIDFHISTNLMCSSPLALREDEWHDLGYIFPYMEGARQKNVKYIYLLLKKN